MSVRHWFAAVLVTVVAIGAIVLAQTPSPSGPATLEALLIEVRGLHADVDRLAGSSIRTQLLVARLQLQEQRINGIAKQLTDVQAQRIANDGGIAQMESSVKRFEEAVRDSSQTSERRREIEEQLAGMQPALEQMTKRRQELVVQENALAGQLAAEQAQWSDFSNRLDQIEREIGRR